MTAALGIVYLVGAGPGDPGLITVRGRDLLRNADVVVYDRLANRHLLNLAPRRAERIDAGKSPGHHALRQEEINTLLVDRARAGKRVVRLKGGDPFVFGRGAEEWAACHDAGVPCLVVPGVSSALAAPLSAGIAVTQRGVARSFAVITAQTGIGESQAPHDFAALAKLDTLVVLMGRSEMAEWSHALINAGKPAGTPVACIAHATTPRQRIVVAPLREIASAADAAEIASPMVAIVGEVAANANAQALRELLPLAGRRVLLAAADDTNQRLANALQRWGAIPVSSPLIRIDDPDNPELFRIAMESIEEYDTIVFTSRHAVSAFFKQLAVMRRDARALADCRIAAIGIGTAGALRRRGIRADLVPEDSTAGGMADALLADQTDLPKRVLHPRSNIASGVLADRLRAAGVQVDDPIAYVTIPRPSSTEAREIDWTGDDAAILCSPSAARAFAESPLASQDMVIVAFGRITASAARAAGLSVSIVANEPTPAGVVDALTQHWSCAGVTA
ncbi:MAG: uroporphyrinogen-III C-methyltransferase [Phycisphaerales bacterium]|nr:uroporphyrinogen-III C-methyltransferase [Phycisphaerales bacterium]